MKEFLQGKKTYIISALAVAAIWVDYFFGLGLSDLCKPDEDCSLTTQQALAATWAAISAITIRLGIGK